MVRQQPSSEYRGYREPGIRLTEPILPELAEYRIETLDEVLDGIHLFDKAHLVMLVECGLVSPADGGAMLAALRDMEREGVRDARAVSGGGMHSAENYLIHRLGEDVGGQINMARSTGDIHEVARRVAITGQVLELLEVLNRLRDELLTLSVEHADAVMPGYTHGQQAQPTTYGHWLSMWASAFARDAERLLQYHERYNLSAAGAGILTGVDYPIDRDRTSELLGFDRPIPHTMDAILSRDGLLEIVSLLSIIGSNMARMGEDLVLWTSDEYAYLDVPDRFCGSSSIMMQKKNPYAPQAMKAAAAEAMALVTAAHYVEKDPTGFAMMERTVTQSLLWRCFASVISKLRQVGDLLAATTVRRERMAVFANAYWAQVTDLGGALVRHAGVSWRTAHQIVSILVRLAVERSLEPADVGPALIDEAAIEYLGRPLGLAESVVASAMDAAACVERRDVFGGPAAARNAETVALLRQRLDVDIEAEGALHAAREAARARLEEAVDRIVG